MPQYLHQHLEEIINNTGPGERLLTEPKLAKQLGVSRATLREAMRTFETQGRLRRKQGVGTFVMQPKQVIESGLEVLESIETLADRIGLVVSMGDLQIKDKFADRNVADKLEIKPGSDIIRISRTIYAEDRPIAFLIDTVPASILQPSEISDQFTGSVLDLFLKKGVYCPDTSKCEIAAVAINQEVARVLNIQRGDALLCFDAVLFSKDGAPMDFSQSYFLPGYFKFHVVRRVDSNSFESSSNE